MSYTYRDEVLRQLAGHGVRPDANTPPSLVRSFLNDLYRYELRRLKNRLLRREFPKPAYFGLVVELRMRYPLLSIPITRWTDQPESSADEVATVC